MLRKKDLRAIGWLSIGVGLISLIAEAPKQVAPPQPMWFGIPADWSDYIAAAQESDMWCWAAAIQMILKRYGVPVTQSQIVTNAYRAPLNEPGTDDAISANLNGLAFTVDGRRVMVRSRVAPGAPALKVLINECSRNNPILFTYNCGTNVGHAVVVTAVECIFTANGPFLISLVYRDPFPTPENVANRGGVELVGEKLEEFLSSVRSHWLISARYA